MIDRTEMHAGIYGAWRLARRDPGGMVWINPTPQGMWNSFWAAILVLPGAMALEILSGGFGDDPGLRDVAVKLIAYTIRWVSYPLLMIYVADSLGCFDRYWRYIAANNWASVVQVGLLLPLVSVAVVSQMPALLFVVQIFVFLLLVYHGYVAYVALGVKISAAIGITVMDLLLALLVDNIATRVAEGLW